MNVLELIEKLQRMPPDADVLFDTEATNWNVHMVGVDAAFYEEEPRPHCALSTSEPHPHVTGTDIPAITERAENAERAYREAHDAAHKAERERDEAREQRDRVTQSYWKVVAEKATADRRIAELEAVLRRARGVLADIINAEDDRSEAASQCFDEGLIDRVCADDCPQDDTCDCPGTTLIGRAVNRRNFHEGDCLRALDAALSAPAQPATATKEVCSHASRYLLRGEVTCVVCNQAIDVAAPPSPAAREATTNKTDRVLDDATRTMNALPAWMKRLELRSAVADRVNSSDHQEKK